MVIHFRSYSGDPSRICVFVLITDRPAKANLLSEEQRQ